MIEEVAEKIYRIEVPLPVIFLSSVNAYLIRGEDRNLLVDAGMNIDLCHAAVEESLAKLGVDLGKTDFFVTHAHPDHFGLVSRFIGADSTLYISREEVETIERMQLGVVRSELERFMGMAGFPKEKRLEEIFPSHVEEGYRVWEGWPFRFVEDGERLDVGQHRFQFVKTPGHSRGHTCLYGMDAHILFSGDHLLQDITPSVQARAANEDPLMQYLCSLDRIYELDVDLVLPGHGLIAKECRKRIKEVKEHHRARAAEVAAALVDGPSDTYRIASCITWKVEADSWDAYPDIQKFFATAETFAHLRYLEEQGVLRGRVENERIVYSLSEV